MTGNKNVNVKRNKQIIQSREHGEKRLENKHDQNLTDVLDYAKCLSKHSIRILDGGEEREWGRKKLKEQCLKNCR